MSAQLGDDILTRVPPQNLEAEQSVLGAILLDNDAINHALEILTAEDFYHEAHREIFRAMAELTDHNQPVDAITLTEALRTRGTFDQIGGNAYIMELAGIVPTAANVAYYSRIVRDKAVLRSLGSIATDIASSSYESPADVTELLEESKKKIFDVRVDRQDRGGLIPIDQGIRNFLHEVDDAQHGEHAINGLATGFTEFDEATGGLQPDDLIVIAARPSMGKTALAIDIARNVSLNDGIVAFFSLEMSKAQVVSRVVCGHAQVSGLKARRGYLSENDREKLGRACAELTDRPLLIDDTAALTSLQLRNRCRLAIQRMRKPLDLIVIDYLQLMRAVKPRDSREREVAEISSALKAVAKEFHVPVLALSQLNRQVETRADKRPCLADLRESGAIEQDADVIAFIYRDEVYNPKTTTEPGIAEVNVAKQRNGPTGSMKLAWLSIYMRFDNYTDRYTPADEPGAAIGGWQGQQQ